MGYSEEETRKRENPRLHENPYKVYVGVFARFTPEGEMEPVCLEWTDGKCYFIDRITDKRRAASRKAAAAASGTFA